MTAKRTAPSPLVLTHPTAAQPVCPACGKQVKDMSRHAGTKGCSLAARRAMIARLGFVEVWFREKNVLTDGHVSVVVIREQKGGRDRRRWYAPPGPVDAMRLLEASGLSAKRVVQLLRGPKDELERELVVAGLRGPQVLPNEPQVLPNGIAAAAARWAGAPVRTRAP